MTRVGDPDHFKGRCLKLEKQVTQECEKVEEAKEEAVNLKRKLEEEVAENKSISKQLKKEEEKAARNEEKLKKVRQEKKKEHDLLMYQRTKTSEAREKVKETEELKELEEELEEERRKNRDLTTENEMLRGALREAEEELEKLEEEKEETITMMDGRQYKPEVIEWIWQLLQFNVAHHQVPKVMEASLKFLGKKADHLPTVKTINNINVSSLGASQRHLQV